MHLIILTNHTDAWTLAIVEKCVSKRYMVHTTSIGSFYVLRIHQLKDDSQHKRYTKVNRFLKCHCKMALAVFRIRNKLKKETKFHKNEAKRVI